MLVDTYICHTSSPLFSYPSDIQLISLRPLQIPLSLLEQTLLLPPFSAVDMMVPLLYLSIWLLVLPAYHATPANKRALMENLLKELMEEEDLAYTCSITRSTSSNTRRQRNAQVLGQNSSSALLGITLRVAMVVGK